MFVRVQLTEKQLQGILATGSAACARSTTVEAPAADIVARAEPLLAKASGGVVGRTTEGALLADSSGPLIIEEWLVQLTTFGPKSTVNLRAARSLRTWVVLTAWFVLMPALGAAAVALLFVVTDRPPGIGPGLAFVGGVIVGAVGLVAVAKGNANRWTRDAYRRLGDLEQALASTPSGSSYRT